MQIEFWLDSLKTLMKMETKLPTNVTSDVSITIRNFLSRQISSFPTIGGPIIGSMYVTQIAGLDHISADKSCFNSCEKKKQKY